MLPFSPYGYDERQYGSPGFNLPSACSCGALARPEYHTSADNLDFIRPESLADSLRRLLDTVAVVKTTRPSAINAVRRTPARPPGLCMIYSAANERANSDGHRGC